MPSETHGVLPVSDARKGTEKSATAAKTHAYEHTTDLGKLTSAYRVLEATGAGVAFTLNCSPDEIAAAQRHPKGFVDYFKRRICSALERALGYAPLYGFGVDVASDDRLHIHGAIAANDKRTAKFGWTLANRSGWRRANSDSCLECSLSGLSGHRWIMAREGSVANDRAARLAAIPAGESPANRGVQSLL